jgi:hypothetical protein
MSALVVVAMSGCALFIAIINYFNHDPIKVTVTSHAIRIDDGDEQTIFRLIDLIEIQRSHSWLMDEIVLKAIGDRGFSLENLRDPDGFLNAIVTNASSIGSSRRANGRAAAFSLVTKHSHVKLQEMIGRRKYGSEANSLELTNNFSAYLLTVPAPAAIPSVTVAAASFLLLLAFDVVPFTWASIGVSSLIAPSLFLIICYAMFVEKHIAIREGEITIETSTDRIWLPKNSIKEVYSRQAGLSRVIKLETKTHGSITLRGYANPDRIEGAIRWVITSANIQNERTAEGKDLSACKSAAEIFRSGCRADS